MQLADTIYKDTCAPMFMYNQTEKTVQAGHLNMGKKILHELGAAKGKVSQDKKRYHQRCRDANARLKQLHLPYSSLQDQSALQEHPKLAEIKQLAAACVRCGHLVYPTPLLLALPGCYYLLFMYETG